MNKYVIYNTISKGDPNAGSKAGRDAVNIAVKQGYEFVNLYEAKGNHTTLGNMISGYLNTRKLCRRLSENDLVFLQYPVNRRLMERMFRMFNKRHVHTVTLIHDIDFLRNVPLGNRGVAGMKTLELSILSQSEFLICHNLAMIKTLKKNGLKSKFISLELFDYLYDGAEAKKTDELSVIVAGNLLEQKAGYIYKLKDEQFKLFLYGSNLSKNFVYPNAKYCGSFSPDELIENMKGNYGLVWDGPDVNTCSGNYGQYLKINNPHKVSLYIAAGLPVIVWKKSALYPFVVKNGIGFGVDSLHEIDDKIWEQNYEKAVQNVKDVQRKVRRGDYLKQALQKVEYDL